jgi:DNA-damage-inducible protein J
MTTNILIQTQIDDAVKKEATTVLAAMGLTISDAIRLMLIKVAHDHRLPFDPFIPNSETIAAMEEARNGHTQSAETVDEFMELIELP